MSRRWVAVANRDVLEPGQYKSVEVEGELIALYDVGGEIYATGDVCTHDGGILTGGQLENTAITCPRHGAQFDVTTGEVLRMPAFEPIPTYETRVENNEIQVLLED